MAKKNASKKALLMSALSILLCLSMLVGSTFAWFTDTASTGVNTIVAGNLDIALYEGEQTVADGKVTKVEYKDEVTTATKLFDDKALWEPGHTEVAYLKVENKGSLALKYQLKINVVNEVVGTSVLGNEIKLSEILKYDVIEQDTAPLYATRDDARTAAAAEAKGLATETITGNMAAGAPAKYLAIVVYMPTDADNKANHKTGTTPPSIQLGVNLVATQVENEKDSFDENYDKGALYPPMPEMLDLTQNVQTTVPANSTPANPVVVENQTAGVKATIPAANYQNAGNAEMTYDTDVSVKIIDSSADSTTYDIDVTITDSNDQPVTLTAPVTVEIDLVPGLKNVKVVHGGTGMTEVKDNAFTADQQYSYNEVSGVLTVYSQSFSPFAISYEINLVAKVGGVSYMELEDAIASAKSGDTITLLADNTVTESITFSGAGNVYSFDLNGNTLTVKLTNNDGIIVKDGATLNLTNSNEEQGEYIFDCNNTTYDAIYVVNNVEDTKSTLNINNPVKLTVNATANSAIHACGYAGATEVNVEDGTHVVVNGAANDQFAAIMLDTNTTMNMNGGKIDINTAFNSFSYNNDAVGIVLYAGNTQNGINTYLNINGGEITISGKNAFAQGVQIGEVSQKAWEYVKVKMNGGKITVNSDGGQAYAFASYNYNVGKFEIVDGMICGALNDLFIEQYGRPIEYSIARCDFSFDPTDYVDTDVYNVTDNNDGTWTVTANTAE